MLVEKKCFSLDSFSFSCGRTIPVSLGYETWGTLNHARDNAILICHFFTGTSHAAGKYDTADEAPGWWDALIGPGKTIDTDRWFVICSDVFSNINANNPRVITTGPSSIDPVTGRPYGMSFPVFTLYDAVRAQRKLVQSLGIEKLVAVMGPSMGGLQALMWGRHFGEMAGKIVSVAATPVMRPWLIMVPNQLGIDAIRLDPKWKQGNYYGGEPPLDGLMLAFKTLLTATRTDEWADRNFGRGFADTSGTAEADPFRTFAAKFLVETEMEKIVLGRMQYFDPNSYMYIAKANSLFDLRAPGQSMEEALESIRVPTLLIVDESDIMFTRDQAETAMKYIPKGIASYYNSRNGHLSCIYESGLFERAIRGFL